MIQWCLFQKKNTTGIIPLQIHVHIITATSNAIILVHIKTVTLHMRLYSNQENTL